MPRWPNKGHQEEKKVHQEDKKAHKEEKKVHQEEKKAPQEEEFQEVVETQEEPVSEEVEDIPAVAETKEPKIEVVKTLPVDTLAEKKRKADEAENARLRAEIVAMRTKLAELDAKPLDVAMKDPYFGTTMYLQVNLREQEDPKNPKLKIYTPGNLSVFPDAVNAQTGDQLSPDIGFDSREQADALRNSDTATCVFKGKEMKVKDAIIALRQDYYERRKAADRKYLATPEFKEAGLDQ